jgi:hypothetical protein
LRTEPKASRSEQLGVTPAHPAEGEHDEAEGERELLSVPTGLTDPATSVIVAEVTYSFTSLLDLKGILNPADWLSAARSTRGRARAP